MYGCMAKCRNQSFGFSKLVQVSQQQPGISSNAARWATSSISRRTVVLLEESLAQPGLGVYPPHTNREPERGPSLLSLHGFPC